MDATKAPSSLNTEAAGKATGSRRSAKAAKTAPARRSRTSTPSKPRGDLAAPAASESLITPPASLDQNPPVFSKSKHPSSSSNPVPLLTPAALLAVPTNFGKHVLGVDFYPWQREILSWFSDMFGRVKASVAAPNGSGKSERVVACLALWWMCMGAKATVVITSKDSRQLDEQIWPAIEQHKGKFQGFVWNRRYIESPTGGRIIGFTTNEPGRAEGRHRQPEGPLLIIVDEAKSVPEAVFEAFDRCTFNGLLYISSTGLMQGRFFDSQTKDAAHYRSLRVRLEDCPHIPKERIGDILGAYGEDHPFTRSTLYSEFMSQDAESAFFFTLAALDRCLQSPPEYRRGDRVAFCDFAGGGDENVLAVREGNRVRIVRAWREANEMAAIGEFIRLFHAEGLTAAEIWGDNCGAGKPMVARFHEVGWTINRFNAGEAAFDPRNFTNRGAEVWEAAGREVAAGRVILPDDAVLRAQLVSRKREVDSRGRFRCESKDDMRKRGVKSPDRADAAVAVIALREMAPIAPKSEVHAPWMQYLSEQTQNDLYESGGALAGCDAGV